MPSVLYTASTFSHILNFHLPYLRRFRELGWQVEVACGGPVRDIPFADGAVSLPLEKKMSSPANFQAASQLRAMVIRQQYDLIITHTSLAAFFTRWALRGLKHRPKLINVVHGYLFDDETSGLKRGLLTRAETMTAPQTDLLLTMNAWDTRWAMAHRAAPRVEEIPGMGVDLTRFRTAPDARRTMRDRLGLSEGDVALLYAAEFSGRKSQHTLLEALPGLPENVKLLLPGSGALLDDCRAQAASLGVADPHGISRASPRHAPVAGGGGYRRILQPVGGTALQHHGGHGLRPARGGQRRQGPHRPDRAGKRPAVPLRRRQSLCRRRGASGVRRRPAGGAGTGRTGEDAALRAGRGAAAGDGPLSVCHGGKNAMMRENQRLLNQLHVFTDGLAVFLAMLVSYWLRFSLFRGVRGMPLNYYIWLGVVAAALTLAVFAVAGLYESFRTVRFHVEASRVAALELLVSLIVMAAIYVLRLGETSRWTVVFFYAVSTLLLTGKRAAMRLLLRRCRAMGYNQKRVLLVGHGEGAEAYLTRVAMDKNLGFRVIGYVAERGCWDALPYCGSYEELDAIFASEKPDEVVVALPTEEGRWMGRIINACEKDGTKLSVVPSYVRYMPANPQFDSVNGLPLINLRRIPLDNLGNAFLKRAADIICSLVLIILTSPLMLIAAIGVKLSSPWPDHFQAGACGQGQKELLHVQIPLHAGEQQRKHRLEQKRGRPQDLVRLPDPQVLCG